MNKETLAGIAIAVLAGLCYALAANAGTVFAYRDADGIYVYTDDFAKVPAKYKAQAQNYSTSDVPITEMSQDADAVVERLKLRLQQLRDMARVDADRKALEVRERRSPVVIKVYPRYYRGTSRRLY